jgi:intein/homing endonuclease
VTTDSEKMFLLYEPCHTKEELKMHVKVFLKVDMPDTTIDEDSNSNPMELLWDLYRTMLTGKGPQRVVVAAARNSMKSLSAAIIRFYSMIHFRRSGTHLAATADQSSTLLMYLDRFIMVDGIKEYLTTNNTRTKEFKNLPRNSFTKNDSCILRVAVATKKGVNSQRGSFNSRDETELIPPEIIREASFISDPTRDEYRYGPIELDLSSRKIADGTMQEKIDEAEMPNPPGDLRLHKWSMADFMQKCPDEIHRPDLPRKQAFLNTETLETIWSKEQYDALGAGVQNQYKSINAYDGCQTCPAFIACQARAPNQTGTSFGLRDISFVGVILKAVKDPDTIIAQALNWRPGKAGNVFRMIRKNKHFLKPIEFYKWCFGEYFIPQNMNLSLVLKAIEEEEFWRIAPTKTDIYNAFQTFGWSITYGVDWGFSPASATCIVTAYNKRQQRAAVFHVEFAQNLANQDWANYIIDNIWSKYKGDYVCPDTADKSSPTYFGRRKVPAIDYKPARINTGVSQLRSLLFDPVAQVERLVILDEGEGNQNMYTAMEKWAHKKSPLGFDFDKFEDDNYCDYCFVPGVMVMTESGAKPIEEIKEGDVVLTHLGNYKKVNKVMSRLYDGEIVNISPFGREMISATPEHPFYVSEMARSNKTENGVKLTGQLRHVEGSEEFKSAKDLIKTQKNGKSRQVLSIKNKDKEEDVFIDMVERLPGWHLVEGLLYRPAGKYGNGYATGNGSHPVNEKVEVTNELSWLLGHYAAEGSASQGIKCDRGGVGIAMHQNEIVCESIYLKLLEQFGNPKISKTFNGQGLRLTISNKGLYWIIKEIGSHSEKKLPNYVFSLSKERIMWLLCGYFYGDGHFSPTGVVAMSISREMIYQLFRLCHKVGLSPRINPRNCVGRGWGGFGGEFKNEQYKISLDISDTNKLLDFVKTNDLLALAFTGKSVKTIQNGSMPSNKCWTDGEDLKTLIRDVNVTSYNGPVYNLSVDDDNSYTVNGVAVHNCDPLRYALAPFVEELSIGISFTNKPPEANLVGMAAKGDKEAIETIRQKNELSSQLEEYYKTEHGVGSLFTPQQQNAPSANKPSNRGSVKFKF